MKHRLSRLGNINPSQMGRTGPAAGQSPAISFKPCEFVRHRTEIDASRSMPETADFKNIPMRVDKGMGVGSAFFNFFFHGCHHMKAILAENGVTALPGGIILLGPTLLISRWSMMTAWRTFKPMVIKKKRNNTLFLAPKRQNGCLKIDKVIISG